MSHSFDIREGAILISDAHFSHKRQELLGFLKAIDSQNIHTTQLILMGDIFDLLFGQIKVTHKRNQEVIDIINTLSKRMDIHYLEGNHDYALNDIFTKVEVYPLSVQPITCTYKNSVVKLAHGDFNISTGYKFYSTLIRLPLVMYLLGFVNFVSKGFIIQKLDKYLDKKEDCNEFTGFENYISRRIKGYAGSCDYFIEGHYHQNKSFSVTDFVYINVAAFACYQRYFIVKSSKEEILELEEAVFKEL